MARVNATAITPTEIETPRLLVRVEEAATLLSLSRSKVYALMAAGELHSVTIGRSRRIPMEALTDYVANLRQQAGV